MVYKVFKHNGGWVCHPSRTLWTLEPNSIKITLKRRWWRDTVDLRVFKGRTPFEALYRAKRWENSLK